MLRVVTDHQPPFVSIEESQNGSAPQYSGFLVELLPMLLQQAHINSSYTLYTTSSGGVQLRNGSWTGVMGELVAGRADLALFPLTLTAKRQQYIQHTQPFMDGGYGILVKAEQVDTGEPGSMHPSALNKASKQSKKPHAACFLPVFSNIV